MVYSKMLDIKISLFTKCLQLALVIPNIVPEKKKKTLIKTKLDCKDSSPIIFV